ncbi:universal stress protein [Rhodococcus aetherivorans]|uniref:universal stress protein n=1 Tax=Rhodococcus aetherivorans TaxID=191292 RepID=UPI00241E6229|nr:universal stress protein [Rhodococcus aetherivorans]WFS14827.1 universal stress protein [Rhodococcus aetherivorans]
MATAPIRHGIVVGIDGSDGSFSAAHWAASAAWIFREPLHLVNVLPDAPSATGGRSKEEFAKLLQADSERLLERARRAALDGRTDVTVECSSRPGPPAKTLVELSKTARLLVVGRTTTGELRSMFAGSDVVRVANHARCPVVAWRGEGDHEEVDTRPVVVGVDGSALSNAAIEHAFEFASFLGVPLIAVHAWTEQSTLRGYDESARFVDWTTYAEQKVADLAESLAGWRERYPDVELRTELERRGAMVALIERSIDAQLVAVGSHGRSTIASALLGSTGQGLLHHSRCPVLICRE